MPRILILHASCGGGHRAAASALAGAFASLSPGSTVRVVDSLDVMSKGFCALYRGAFDVAVTRAPRVYSALFSASRNLDRWRTFRAARRLSSWLNAERLGAMIRRSRADAVVCTHFLPLEVALREKRKGGIEAPVYGVVTDYTAHGLWRQPDAERTFCPSGLAASELVAGGVAPSRISVTGIPIDPRFGERFCALDARARWGFAPGRRVAVLLAGGSGHGPLGAVMEATAREVGAAAEIVVVCGRNEALRASIERAAARLDARVRVHGFVSDMLSLLRAADVVVSKPGGLTTSEVLALGKPLVLYVAAPGQESANARFAVERGGAVDGGTPEGAAAEVARLLADPLARELLGWRARALGRPDAARTIARSVLAHEPLALPVLAHAS